MLGFHPIAGAPVADSGLAFDRFFFDSIVLGAPAVGDLNVTNIFNVACSGFSTAAPNIDSTDLTLTLNIECAELTAGSPTFGAFSVLSNGTIVDFNAPDFTEANVESGLSKIALENLGISSISIEEALSEVAQ